MPARVSAGTLLRPPNRTTVDGLQHAECLVLMRFGAPIVSLDRLQLRRFAMFAQWDDEAALEMVHGRSDVPSAHVHQVAMAEQRRKDFHYESTFMRFRPLSEHGQWQGRQLLPGSTRH